jgi:O-antigen/teichoic acid export membrane protein
MTAAASPPEDVAGEPAESHRSVASGIVALGGAEVASRLIAFATAALLARRLGPEVFGVLGLATALCGYFGIIAGGALTDIAAREVARHPSTAADVYRRILAVRLPLAVLALAGVIVFAWLVPRPPQYRLLIAVSALSLLSTALDPSWAVKALQRGWLAGSATVTGPMIVLMIAFRFITGPAHAIRMPLAQFAVDVAIAGCLLWVLLRTPRTPSQPVQRAMALLRESVPLLFGRGMRATIVSFDMVLLGFIASGIDLGVYSAVYRLHFFVLALVVAVRTVYLPIMTRAAIRGPAALRHVAGDALAGGAIIGAPLVAGGIITAGPVLAFLFGAPYDQGARALQWLLVSLGFVFVHGLLHNIYLVTGRTHIEARWFAAGAVVNVLANLLLIPRFGIAGAAAATAMAEAVIVAGGILVTRIATPLAVVQAWIKPACAAALMGATVWTLRDLLPIPVQCAVGAAVYGTAIIMLAGPRAVAMRLGF